MSLSPNPENVSANPFEDLQFTSTQFRGNIRRTFTIWFTILALIPVVLLVIANYLQSRAAITDQVNSQLRNTIQNSSNQLDQIGFTLDEYLPRVLNSDQVSNAIDELLKTDQPDLNAKFSANYELFSYLQSNREISGTRIDHAVILNENGDVLASTNNLWRDQNFLDNPTIGPLLTNDLSIATYNSPPFYENTLIFFSSRTIPGPSDGFSATLIITATSTIPDITLTAASSAYTGARAYYLTWDKWIVSKGEDGQLTSLTTSTGYNNQISELVESQGQGRTYYSYDNTSVIGYGTKIPSISLGLLVESREDVVFQPITSLIPTSIILIGLALILTLAAVFIGSNRLVQPLVDLAKTGKTIITSKEIDSTRLTKSAGTERKDEIGVISTAFGKMAEKITHLETAFQSQIVQRTQSMRTAADIVRQATSTTRRQELVERTCQLLVEKFGHSFACLYTLDESQTYAILQGMSQVKPQPKIPENYRVNVAADSLVGWVALNNKIRIVQDFDAEPAYRSLLTVPNSRSEIALPIHSATDSGIVTGVLSIQNPNLDHFDADNISVLENLTAQIAAGLQNIQVFEATEHSLQELELLYDTSRQIAQAQSEIQMIQILNTALAKTDYVSGVFSVEPIYMSVLGIIDPRSPNVTTAQGITLPLLKMNRKIERNSMILVEYLTQPSEFDNLLSFFSRRGCHSAVLFFVFNKESLSKIFVIGSRSLSPLQKEKIAPFSNLVEVMSTSLEHFQVMGSLEMRLGELQTLAEISKAISAETDLNQLYTILHAEMQRTFGSDVHFLIATYEEKASLIHIPYMFDEGVRVEVEPFPLGQGLTSILIRNREPLMLVKDTERKAAELGARIIGKTAKSWLGVPLMIGGKVLGAMVLQDTDNEERFNDNDLRLMVTLSSPVANAIRNAQLLTEMHQALSAYDQERFLLNSLLENIPDLIYFKNKEGKFIRASNSTLSHYGLTSAEELQDKTMADLFPNRMDVSSEITAEEEILTTNQPLLNEVIFRQVNEEVQEWALVSKIPLKDSANTVVGLLGIESDITTLKATEQLAQRRSEQILTAAEIARDTTTELDVAEILTKSINLIRERFGFYHASIFLLDPLKEYALLRESTGEVGRAMKERQHRLAVGSQSIVGRVTATGKSLVINDVTQDPDYFANPLLPDTRSELAIPLQAGKELLGAIDVQSNRLNAFTSEDVNILQILADQLAVAVLKANLFNEAQETLQQHQVLHDITNQASAVDSVEKAADIIAHSLHNIRQNERILVFLLNTNHQLQVVASAGYDQVGISNLIIPIGQGIIGSVAATKNAYRIDDVASDPNYFQIDSSTRSELAVPILYGDQLMGVINIESPEAAAYDANDQEIIATLGTNLGTILANTRLVNEVRQQVERQRQLYEITSRIRRSVDVQTILKTFTTEVCNAVQARSAKVRITVAADGDRGEYGSAEKFSPNQPTEP